MPQISQLMEVYLGQFFWLLIVIGIIYFGIARNMVPKISKTVDDRQKRITDDLAAAQAGQDKAEQIESDYRTSINEARAAAIDFVNEAKAKVALKNEAAIKRAETAIGKKAQGCPEQCNERNRSGGCRGRTGDREDGFRCQGHGH